MIHIKKYILLNSNLSIPRNVDNGKVNDNYTERPEYVIRIHQISYFSPVLFPSQLNGVYSSHGRCVTFLLNCSHRRPLKYPPLKRIFHFSVSLVTFSNVFRAQPEISDIQDKCIYFCHHQAISGLEGFCKMTTETILTRTCPIIFQSHLIMTAQLKISSTAFPLRVNE